MTRVEMSQKQTSFEVADVQGGLWDSDDEASTMIIFEDDSGRPEELANSLHIILLSCGNFGLSIVWSLIQSNGYAQLQLLGLSKVYIALAWAAGPLAGTFVQPLIGAYSDRCQSSWGRRRPFILCGLVSTVLNLLLFAWSKDSGLLIESVLGLSSKPDGQNLTAKVFAFILVYALNVTLQPLQFGVRALLMDTVPSQQQGSASAWATRFGLMGNLLGYWLSSPSFQFSVPFLGQNSNFKCLSIVASILLTTTTCISCLCVSERPLLLTSRGKITGVWSRFLMAMFNLPPICRWVFKVQFFSWMGWFPFLYYHTIYVGKLYDPNFVAEQTEKTTIENAKAMGSRVSFCFALMALLSNLMLPQFLQTPTQSFGQFGSNSDQRKWLNKFTGGYLRISISRAWTLSHCLFGTCMLATLLSKSYTFTAILITLSGISWALTCWIPFTLIGEEICEIRAMSTETVSEEKPSRENHVGSIVGAHNIAIAGPQILAAIICSLILNLMNTWAEENSLGWLLRFGGLAALVAAFISFREEPMELGI